MEPALPICEHKPDAYWNPVNINILENLELSNIIGAYLHSMNSQSSCLAFCGSKDGIQSIILLGSKCLCLKGNFFIFFIFSTNKIEYAFQLKADSHA